MPASSLSRWPLIAALLTASSLWVSGCSKPPTPQPVSQSPAQVPTVAFYPPSGSPPWPVTVEGGRFEPLLQMRRASRRTRWLGDFAHDLGIVTAQLGKRAIGLRLIHRLAVPAVVIGHK